MPLGVLRLARPRRAALALPRTAAVAARGDRADRAGRPVPAPRLHAGQVRPRLPALPPARDAVRDAAARAHLGDRPGLPRDRRDAPARAGVRARGLPRAAVRLVHDAARVRRAGRAASRRSPASTASTPRRSSRALDDPAVEAAYQADRAEARTAEGKPTHAQGKAAQSDGPVRYTAPSLIFESGGRSARGRRLPARRGLRRPARQPRPDARAHAAARGPARGPAGAALRARRPTRSPPSWPATTRRPTRRPPRPP